MRQVYIPELMSRVNQSVWRVHHGNFTLGQFWTVGYEASADTPQLHPVWRFNCWDDTSCAAADQEAYHMAPDAHGVWDQPQHARALGREFFGPKLVWEWTEEELEENAREVERNRKKAEEKKRQREEKKRAKDQVEHARWAEREGERLIQMEDYGADTLSKQDLSARTWGSICAACKSECTCLPPGLVCLRAPATVGMMKLWLLCLVCLRAHGIIVAAVRAEGAYEKMVEAYEILEPMEKGDELKTAIDYLVDNGIVDGIGWG